MPAWKLRTNPFLSPAPLYTTNARTAGSGGLGFLANGGYRGNGAGGGGGGSTAKYGGYTGYTSVGNGGNGGDGSPGYVRIEPVKPPVPVAGFNMTPFSGQYPVNVQFTDMSIGYPTSWTWNFGDGGTFTTTDPGLRNANHTYTAAGTYSVTLTAGNSQGAQAISHPVYVTGPPGGTNAEPGGVHTTGDV